MKKAHALFQAPCAGCDGLRRAVLMWTPERELPQQLPQQAAWIDAPRHAVHHQRALHFLDTLSSFNPTASSPPDGCVVAVHHHDHLAAGGIVLPRLAKLDVHLNRGAALQWCGEGGWMGC